MLTVRAICVKGRPLTDTLSKLKEARSGDYRQSGVRYRSIQVPMDIPLTSFSILMARKKGLLEEAVRRCGCHRRG